MWDRAALQWGDFASPISDSVNIFKDLREAKKILILPNDRVGGLFIGAPIYKMVRQAFPEAEVDLLVEVKKAALARQIPFIDRVVSGPLDRPVWSAAFKDAVEQLQREKYDLSLCLGPDCSFRLAQICGSSGARLRVGFHRRGINSFNIEVVQKNPTKYEGDQYLDMFRLFGINGEPEIKWTLARENAQQIRARYLGDGEISTFTVGVDLAGGEGRGLSVKQLDSVVGRIIERGAVAVLFFSLAEKKKVTYLKETYGSKVRPFEQDDLPGVAALLEACTTVISCNTDLLHLALALQVPVVGIFEDDPQRWISTRNALVKVIRVRDMRGVDVDAIMEGLERARRARKT